MKKIVLYGGLMLISTFIYSQESKKIFGNLDRSYPWYNFTIETGVGVHPYGTNSINNRSSPSSRTITTYGNHVLSQYLSLSYTSKKNPFGLFVDLSLNQYYSGDEWLPFDWKPNHPDFDNSKINILHFFETRSNAINFGVLYGNEILKGLELYAKLGYGNSWHNYEIAYYEMFYANKIYSGKYKKQSSNYQVAIDFRYFPMDIIGFSGSFGISNNFPVFTLSSAWKFGYKARKTSK